MNKYFLPVLLVILFIVDCFLLVILVLSIMLHPKVSYIEYKQEVFKEEKRISNIELYHNIKKYDIIMTSFNNESNQTDGTPCESSIGIDICELYNQGQRPIALSQDMIFGTKGNYCRSNCPFNYGDRVKIESEVEQCNFEGVVLDTMNSRWKMKGDIFYPLASMNTSCKVFISKIKP